VGGTVVVTVAVGIAIAIGVANRLEARRLKAALLGTWAATDGQLLVVEFHADGTARMTPLGTEVLERGSPDLTEAEFEPAGRGLVELQLTNPRVADKYTFRASVNQDELILSEFKGHYQQTVHSYGLPAYTLPPATQSMTLRRVREPELSAGLRPLGSFSASGLSGPGVAFAIKKPEDTFLVVGFWVSRHHLNPTPEEYRQLKLDDPRERVFRYDARRFTLVLADGRRLPGEMVTGKTGNVYYRAGYVESLISGETPTGKLLAVAWLVRAEDCKPPLMAQVDEGPPVPIPNRQIRWPPG
jgi:hypothetical protein